MTSSGPVMARAGSGQLRNVDSTMVQSQVRKRTARAVVISLVLILVVVGLLTLADSNTPALKESCRAVSAWLPYLGCTMSVHEDLAAGLIGGAGALFAAWLAFDAIQEQISLEEQRRLHKQAEAKAVATLCIAPPIQAAAAAFAEIKKALQARGEQAEVDSDRMVTASISYVKAAMGDSAIQEIAGGLELDDRRIYQSIVGTLKTFVTISMHPSPALNRVQQLQNQARALANIQIYLRAFGDEDLHSVFARDSDEGRQG